MIGKYQSKLIQIKKNMSNIITKTGKIIWLICLIKNEV